MSADLTPHSGLRASDADRDRVAQHLATALSEGRLDLAEYEQRLDTAMGAVTMGDLVPLTADLPAPRDPAAAAAPDNGPVDLAETGAKAAGCRKRRKGVVAEWRDWAGGAVIMSGIWLVTSIASGEMQTFWPIIPLGIWAAVLVASLLFGDKD
ncbi:DUF1707 domain-containing protein [Streptomonospora sp. S1-112]|uniref:DUF1707 domain-containing protein n=1 Tax=Streptomonospora mangrovi TaxID=2883123 RepID=A0A9X3SIB5_9ACTN|nr:DUF1707 domain-containing protein [Streptomonospora mangrovi]MDA0566084.1 DUF1707 domain-containing protein [Streptomonospora mangrovi]